MTEYYVAAYNRAGKELQESVQADYERHKARILAERVNRKNLDKAFEAMLNPAH